MKWLYNLSISSFKFLLPILGLFFKRLKTFRQERQQTKKELETFINQNQHPIIWIHVASLGEYEQVVPVIKALKPHFKPHKFLLSFFSDSGYHIKKNKSIADFETYLPLDTKQQSQDFVNLIKPQFAIFVKYDIWPNFLNQLKAQHIKTFLVLQDLDLNRFILNFMGHSLNKLWGVFIIFLCKIKPQVTCSTASITLIGRKLATPDMTEFTNN
ncbi:3-deoxy-D-manno-octulosonic acid transferase [Flavobacterium sp. CS20]|uniref:3-deoxy-D-manno-octulosonic acid transferase n=1 Tax=Flavobacterium sp. CS20 TaxID=2775246 RepID=UPI001B3A35DD|nr:hypothetical protein IGB25_12695 [Flavobacterium sp. CS20]